MQIIPIEYGKSVLSEKIIFVTGVSGGRGVRGARLLNELIFYKQNVNYSLPHCLAEIFVGYDAHIVPLKIQKNKIYIA